MPDIDHCLSPLRRAWFQYFWVSFALLLFGATFRLWTGDADFPQIPLIAAARSVPKWVDLLLCVGMVAGLGSLLIGREGTPLCRRGLELFLLTLGSLFLLNQHRLQPWAVQFWWIAWGARFIPAAEVAFWWRWLVIAIYVFSAISKFDASFAEELGQRFLLTAGQMCGWSLESWSESARRGAAWMFPGWELLAACLLCYRRTRILGLAAAWILHGALLTLLGPWGMNHHAGVLLWNLFFITQAGLFFWPCRFRGDVCPVRQPLTTVAGQLQFAPRFLFVLMFFAPLLHPFGLWDLWPAWGLYASHGDRVSLVLPATSRGNLPPSSQSAVDSISPEGGNLALKFDRWSLDALHAPIYPQGRFWLGAAWGVLQRIPDSEPFEIRWQLAPRTPWSNVRQTVILRDRTELESRLRQFRVNAFPRESR